MQLSKLALLRGDVTRTIGIAALASPKLRAVLGRSRKAPIDGATVDERLAAMLALDDLMNASDLRSHTPRAARAKLAESIRSVEERIEGGVAVDDLRVAGGNGSIPARRYVPRGLEAPSPGVLFIHGGGFVTGDLDTHDSLCRRIAKDAGARVVAVDYRLAPEAPFPAAVDDVLAAFRDVAGRAAELGIDASRLAVMGDSAGGNLSAVTSLRTRGERHKPALQVLIYPAVDATCAHRSHVVLGNGYMLTKGMLDWYYGHYLGDDPAKRRHPDASPLFADDFEGLPPALVYTAGFDPLRDEAAVYAERLTKAGVTTKLTCFETMIHGFTLMGGLVPAAKDATAQICRDVGEALREGLR